MARAVQVTARLAAVLLSAAAVVSPLEAVAADGGDPLLSAASKHLYENHSGIDAEGFRKISGRYGMECRPTKGGVQIKIPAGVLSGRSLFAITPDGVDRRLVIHQDAERISSGVVVRKSADFDTVTVSSDAVDRAWENFEASKLDRYRILPKPGAYKFLVTNYLPNWYPDDMSGVSPGQFEVFAYCAMDVQSASKAGQGASS